jgi:hypothetical protein
MFHVGAKGGRGSKGGDSRKAVSTEALRGRVVIDKSFFIMALACVMAPIVGAGIYVVVNLF